MRITFCADLKELNKFRTNVVYFWHHRDRTTDRLAARYYRPQTILSVVVGCGFGVFADLSDVFYIKRLVEYIEQLVVLLADNDINVIVCLA